MYQKIIHYYQNLASFTTEEIDKLISKLKTKTYKRKDHLIREGQVCNNVFFVDEGILRSYRRINGIEKTVDFYFPGDYCSSYESFLTQNTGSLNIEVLKDAKIHQLTYQDVCELNEYSPAFNTVSRKVGEFLYIKFSRKASSLVQDDAKTRYNKLIVQRPQIIKHIPNYLIASFLGITPESLSRIKKY